MSAQYCTGHDRPHRIRKSVPDFSDTDGATLPSTCTSVCAHSVVHVLVSSGNLQIMPALESQAHLGLCCQTRWAVAASGALQPPAGTALNSSYAAPVASARNTKWVSVAGHTAQHYRQRGACSRWEHAEIDVTKPGSCPHSLKLTWVWGEAGS